MGTIYTGDKIWYLEEMFDEIIQRLKAIDAHLNKIEKMIEEMEGNNGSKKQAKRKKSRKSDCKTP